MFSPSLCFPATGWLWHRTGFFRFLGTLYGVVEEIELSWVAGLPCLLGGSTALKGWFSWRPASIVPSCEGQAFRGERMGATWTHVRFGSELWPVLYFDSMPSSLASPSFPFVSSFSWFLSVSDAEDRGGWMSLSSWSCLALFSSELMRGHLTNTGEGMGESVLVQLSLRFYKMNTRGICIWSENRT